MKIAEGLLNEIQILIFVGRGDDETAIDGLETARNIGFSEEMLKLILKESP
ncbi:MAG: hypothetical protein MJ119_01550 [Lachnospiraceae bacterium]|nr:hypothetical protein [Lachnospiraceae bacterium]